MTQHLWTLIGKYAHRGLFLDTNVLLLHFIGGFREDLISRFKRTSQFTPDDFRLLRRVLSRFQPWVTTPNVLTEVNGLSSQLGEPLKTEYFVSFARGITLLAEEYVPSTKAASGEVFPRLGLTDAGIVEAVRGRYLVLSDDLELTRYLAGLGVDALNFNHLRA